MQVEINGQTHKLEDGMNVAALINELGLDNKRIAIERNLTIVHRTKYDETLLEAGDQIEIVEFIGGG